MTAPLTDMNALMSQMRIMSSQASGTEQMVKNPTAVSFANTLGETLKTVNDLQMTSGQIKDAFEKGADIPLTQVMLASQKSALAFQATLQVRNKVLAAYQDIMNMPV